MRSKRLFSALLLTSVSAFAFTAAHAAPPSGSALLQRFRPVIYLHPDEQYFPMGVVPYFTGKSTRMVDGKNVLVPAGQVTMQRIYDEYVRRGKKFQGNVHFINDDAVKRGDARPRPGQPLRTPLAGLTFERDGRTYLQYFPFYGYNGWYPLSILGVTLKKNLTGAHWGDIEHITVRLNRARTAIESIFFAAHGGDDGMRLEGASLQYLEREGVRPVVYSAVNGHGSYPRAGAWVRLATAGTDVTGRGTRWDPTLFQVFPDSDSRFNPKTMGWMYVPGQIGPDGIAPVAAKDWFLSATERPVFRPLENWCPSTKDTLCLLKKMGGKAQWAPIVAEIKSAMKKAQDKAAAALKAAASKVKEGAKKAADKVKKFFRR